MGSNFGTETHTLTVAEMPTHTHGVNDPGHTHSFIYNGNDQNVNNVAGTDIAADQIEVSGTTGSNATGITLSNAGGSNAHNNMQPTLFVGNMFIYSGKSSYGNNPFTAGIYTVGGSVALGSNLV